MKEFKGNEMEINKGLKILTFTAPWCGDCKFIEPFLPLIEKEHQNFDFVEINIDDFKEIAEKMSVKGIPSFVALSDGKEIGRFVNGDRKTKAQIDQFIDGLEIK
ncbi:thioredoxin family protein [Xylocopilactobacillus apicola]|uniref:Thiol reductase thioredoxin n=1 Tax=Xylocopilactobacillus apicola TaxID=2932184 RepID=A0AAU9DN85_9LACO|nr:thioredoxin family protein [Xylocopilactobacillus apicola]BDR58512.1 thiol reductase thioredoxin [Xylocopilactobacillus apicola]